MPKSIKLWVLGIMILAIPLTAEGNPPPPSGQLAPSKLEMAPEIHLKDLEGKAARLSDYRGKVVLLHFWACWCQPCVDEFPKIKWLGEHMRGRDFVILTVAADNRQAVEKFVKTMEISFPVLIDQYGSALRSYGIQALPSSYLIGRDGRVKGMAMGPREWGSSEILRSLESAMEKGE